METIKSEKLDFTVTELTEQHKREMEKHANFSQETIATHYNEICTNYEDIYLRVGFHDPRKCADHVIANQCQFPDLAVGDAEVLDLGCGTGLVGQYLHEAGYRNIIGVDASKGMLEECENKRPEVHSGLVELFLGSPDTFPADLRDRFDFVTASGILADNHLDCSVFEEMLLALKTGGVCVFATRTEYLEKYGYGDYMQKLTDEGRWKLLTNETFGRYDNQTNGQIGRFTPTEAQVFAY